jgi:sucrose phosphorylase
MPISDAHQSQILGRLRLLYGDQASEIAARIDELVERFAHLRSRGPRSLWDERRVVLITYGDQVQGGESAALETLRQFLIDRNLDQVVSDVHVLPFFPYSSDDGFSVIDYRRVNADVGDWGDVAQFRDSFGMMFDFVLNHCSQQHAWFQAFLSGEPPCCNYFIDVDPSLDLSAVTRPRSLPLLTPFETTAGTKHVWTTFSADQVDLNFACPDLLIEAIDILLSYVDLGADLIRLDAIGFLWKRIGTNCMHLPETHAVVKLMRDVLDDLAPGTILITETNVPHDENVSYFGDGDEAHAVYQFSLAPLLLDAFLTGDARPLNRWLSTLNYPEGAMTFFNFTASHDGIGVRPLEGLVSQERLNALVEAVKERGGRVSTRRQPDGTDTPYELNITYLSALDTPDGLPADLLARKFLTSQAIMLALRGIPGIYFHSLFGTKNDHDGVQRTGMNRSINRRRFGVDELNDILTDEASVQRQVLDGYRHLLAVRTAQPAFHPDAQQTIVDTSYESLVAFTRTSTNGEQQIHVLANVSDAPVVVNLAVIGLGSITSNLLNDEPIADNTLELGPHSTAWLT